MSHKLIKILVLILLYPSLIKAEQSSSPINITSQQMEMLEKGKVALFSGQVKVSQDENVLFADKVWHYLREDRVEAEGNVHFQEIKDKETMDIYGDKIVYDRKQNYGIVTGHPKMTRKDPADPKKDTIVTGNKIEVFQTENRAKISGNVEITQSEAKSKSEVADYYGETRKLVLTGSPWVWQKNPDNIAEYTGEVITLFTDTKNVIIDKDVQAKITPIKKGDKGNF